MSSEKRSSRRSRSESSEESDVSSSCSSRSSSSSSCSSGSTDRSRSRSPPADRKKDLLEKLEEKLDKKEQKKKRKAVAKKQPPKEYVKEEAAAADKKKKKRKAEEPKPSGSKKQKVEKVQGESSSSSKPDKGKGKGKSGSKKDKEAKEETSCVKFIKVHKAAIFPRPASSGSVGYDFFCLGAGTIMPYQMVKIPTGIKVSVPKGYYGQIFSRSGVTSKHMVVVHVGVIDRDFTGEVELLVFNHGQHPFPYSQYDRLGQIVFLKRYEDEVQTFDEKGAKVIVNTFLTNGERGANGFGSTGGAAGLKMVKYQP